MNLIFADVRERQGENQLDWEKAHAELYVPYATSIKTALEKLEEAYNSDIKVTSGWLAQRRRQKEYA